MEFVQTPEGQPFTLQFTAGMPKGPGPWVYLTKDGSVHAGDVVTVDNALSPTGKSDVVRTTNPTGGLHHPFDIPVSRVLGHAFAGQQWPFSRSLA